MSEMQGRKRSKLACKTCREFKRKCDGTHPCGTCTRFEYDCVYSRAPGNKRKKVGSPKPSPAQSQPSVPEDVAAIPTTPATNHLRSLEANSGAAFLRRLALGLDPNNAPRMHTFAYNAFLGARQVAQVGVVRPITETLSVSQMRDLAGTYFNHVDPIYGFIDRAEMEALIDCTWSSEAPHQTQVATLCGIAALGYLFSHVDPIAAELDLVETTRCILNETIAVAPTADTITAWVLRVVYLRVGGTPHTAWMSSCILMHMIEAAGLHLESPEESVLLSEQEGLCPDTRKRLVAVAQHLNIWMSFDMGRSRVTLRNATSTQFVPRTGDYTHEIIQLLPYSAFLDPENSPTALELETALLAVAQRHHTASPSILAQSNLVLCLCRRLQSMNMSLTGVLLSQVLSVTSEGINAAQAILVARSPWHQMANVPFQIISVLLTVDTASAILQVKDAMKCLSDVAAVYKTAATNEALKTASLLILLYKRRKEKLASDLGEILQQQNLTPSGGTYDSGQPRQQQGSTWLGTLDDNMFPLADLDLDVFFNGALFDDA